MNSISVPRKNEPVFNINLRFLMILCVFLFLSPTVFAQVTTNNLGTAASGNTGRLDVARLSDFAPVSLAKACDLLVNGSSDEAGPLFQQELEHNPNDLAAFVGFAQSHQNLWVSRIARLENAGTWDGVSQFKLGLLLFYQWKMESAYGRQANIRQLVTAKRLLTQAWSNRKDVVIGMALVETTRVPFPDDKKADSLLEELTKQLAGPDAFQAYKDARLSRWQAPPPSAKIIAQANRRPLHGVLSDLWSRAGSQIGYSVVTDGKTQIVWKPVTSDKQTEESYLNAWRTALLLP